MNNSSQPLEIRKEAFTAARISAGLSTKDLGALACLSTRQIEQIENGESSSFYGSQVKYTAAKKVAKLLKLSEENAFELGLTDVIQAAPEIQKEMSEQIKTAQSSPDLKKQNKKTASEIRFSSGVPRAQASRKKKFFLGFSLLAVIVFSVINLRLLFFADKPEEILLVKEGVEIAPVVPADSAPLIIAPPMTVSGTPSETSIACPAEEGILSFKPESPRKVADMVHIQVKSAQTVCVVDASGKIQNKTVEPGAGTSFFGRPPFKVLTNGIAQVDIYFQGAKVRPVNPNIKTLILEAAAVAASPTDRSDSQFR
jgi:transcriptional regulator with XRE-family HTH domain